MSFVQSTIHFGLHLSPPPLQSLSPTQTLIGVDVLQSYISHMSTVFFLVTILSLDLLNGSLLFIILMLKQNIKVYAILSLNHDGFTIFYQSFIFLFLRPHW